MRLWHLTCLALALSLAAPLRAEGEPPPAVRVLVTEVSGPESLDKGMVSTLSRLIESEVRRAAPDLHVVTMKAVRASLEVAAVKACLDSDSSSCMADLAGALGCDFVVSAYLGQVGSQRVLTLSVFRAADALVLAQVSRRVAADDDDGLLDAVAPLVREVLQPTGVRLAAEPPASALPQRAVTTPPASSGALPMVLLTTGVTAGGLLIAGGAVAHGVAFFGYHQPYTEGRLDRETARAWEEGSAMWIGVPIVAYVAGAALVGGGLLAGAVLE